MNRLAIASQVTPTEREMAPTQAPGIFHPDRARPIPHAAIEETRNRVP